MPNHSIKMIKLRQVFGLYGPGYGSRSISTTLGISRTTIRKYLRIFNESYAPIWLPTNQFLKVLTLAGFPQITLIFYLLSSNYIKIICEMSNYILRMHHQIPIDK